jgi:hypothetical protein
MGSGADAGGDSGMCHPMSAELLGWTAEGGRPYVVCGEPRDLSLPFERDHHLTI